VYICVVERSECPRSSWIFIAARKRVVEFVDLSFSFSSAEEVFAFLSLCVSL